MLFHSVQVFAANITNSYTIPSSADVSRIKLKSEPKIKLNDDKIIAIPSQENTNLAPKEASNISINLSAVKIIGSSVFTEADFKKIYEPYLNKPSKLDIAWIIAEKITALYRKNGYFISRSFVPEQEISNGILTLKIVEGYIGHVVFDGATKNLQYLESYARRLKSLKPVKSDDVENFLLLLKDLPGFDFSAILEPSSSDAENAVQLRINIKDQREPYFLTTNNHNSRYFGPYGVSLLHRFALNYANDLVFNIASAAKSEELKIFAANYNWYFKPKWSLQTSGIFAKAKPQYRLEEFDITNYSKEGSVALIYQLIRQRQQNVSILWKFGAKNNYGKILGGQLNNDNIRYLEFGANYAGVDRLEGINGLELKLRQGVQLLGSSDKSDRFLSRDKAEPSFLLMTANWERQQVLLNKWRVTNKIKGQWSTDILFSSEQFGHGGVDLGRAYDLGEITGDSGLGYLAELGFLGTPKWLNCVFEPYMSYDIGKVWNNNKDKTQSAASATIGVKLNYNKSWNADFGLALPLTRKISTPIYGNNGKNPKLLMELVKSF